MFTELNNLSPLHKFYMANKLFFIKIGHHLNVEQTRPTFTGSYNMKSRYFTLKNTIFPDILIPVF